MRGATQWAAVAAGAETEGGQRARSAQHDRLGDAVALVCVAVPKVVAHRRRERDSVVLRAGIARQREQRPK